MLSVRTLVGRSVSGSSGVPSMPSSGGERAQKPLAGTRHRIPKVVLVALAVGVVVLVILAIVLWIGAAPSGSAGGPDSFSEALNASAGVLNSISPGAWNVTGAVGISATVPFSLNNTLLAAGCNVTSGEFGPTSYPAGSGVYSTGAATVWVLSFVPPHEEASTLWVQVVNGHATELGAALGGKCSGYSGSGVANAIDSSAAIRTILATTNGSRFEETFPHANATFSLNPGTNPTWTISLNACGRYTLGPGTLLASVWALNGTIQNAPREPAVIAC